MAIGGTPVGNMVIKVDLDSTGVEKSMTGLQRQLRSSNKAMGAQLSAFSRGEKSAAKYGVLIEGLSNRHRIQGQMVQEARKKYDEMVRTYGENSVKAQEAAQKLNEQIALYQETGRELDTVTAEYKEFQRVQDMQSKGWYKAADSMEEWGGKLKATGQVMDDTGKTLTKRVTMPLAAVGGIATKVGSDFEAGMSRVGATSGASAEDMKKLEAKAREMGATTVFSASEASDAFYYMSLAGWDAADMMDGISGVMDLAAASGEDLALVSDIVTDGLTAFGLSAKESGRMADVLAAASSNANTDVAGLGQAFSYVAPLAGALGYSMEDTSKAIGLMANAGIKSTKAGTALRTIMSKLTDDTDKSRKNFKKYGISITDSNGKMKSFDAVMRQLRKNIGKLDEKQQAQAVTTLFGREAMAGALAIINASEKDYNDLTKAINESEGAASEMADVMQDNLQGSMKELKSMVEDLFIEMYQNLKPTFESIIDSAKNLTKWFSDLSPETQKNIVKFGLLAAAMGPVLSITGKLTMGIGGLMQGAGALTKAIGMSKNVGLLGAMGSLGPLAIGGVAVAGLTAVGVAIHKNVKKSDKLKEVNLDLAQSFSDQASELENSADTFDRLSGKAKISNSELARLNDLNIRISKSSNPGEIKELQKQYEELAKNSGLSKDELKELFEANANIIKQSPEVEKSVSDQGNAFVENTDAVREYIDSLREATLIELTNERQKALENEKKIRDDINQKQGELNGLLENMNMYNELNKLSQDEIKSRIEEINSLYRDSSLSAEEKNNLQKEHTALLDIQNGQYTEATDRLQGQIDKKNESIEKSQEELDKINVLNEQMANLVLKQAGINEEGEKGLTQLDEKLAKNEAELLKLEDKKRAGIELNEKEQERYDKLSQTVDKQNEAKEYLIEELGVYRDINSLAEHKIKTLGTEDKLKVENLARTIDIKTEEGNIVKQIENKNKELLEERKNLEENRKKQGANKKEIDEQIQAIDLKIGKNDQVLVQILKEIGVWDDVKDSINLSSKNIGTKNNKMKETVKNLIKQSVQHDKNNKKSEKGVKIEEKRTKEAGKSVDKDVNLKAIGAEAVNKVASSPVTKPITLVAKVAKGLRNIAGYAASTTYDTNCMVLIGDETK